MDNVTHTLVGLALAESGLKRASRLAMATLVIGANLPDLDVLVYFTRPGTAALGFRRGWTHGILAMIVLPLLLTAGALGWDRMAGRQRTGPLPSLDPAALLGLAALAVWSHPVLDLLNTYGVRLLMPFSQRWFYGDALFIIDPWIWLGLGVGILMARRRGGERIVASPEAPIATRRTAGPARGALALVAGYAAGMAIAGRVGERIVASQTSSGVGKAVRTMVAPVFGNPFRRDVIRDLGDRYELGTLRLGFRSRYSAVAVQPVGRDQPSAAAASATKAGARFLSWARFPRFDTAPDGDSIRVTISDIRYAGMRGGSWASVIMNVPRHAER